MCQTVKYTAVYPDGREVKTRSLTLCELSYRNQPCNNHIVFRGSREYVDFPPTPSYSPQPSSPVVRNGEESDRSHRSERRRVPDIRTTNYHLSPSGRRGERIIVAENPPTPRTPPQSFTFPRTAPTSPNMPQSNLYSTTPPQAPAPPSPRRRRHRMMVDETTPKINIQFVDTPPRTPRHERTSSKGSTERSPRLYSTSNGKINFDLDKAQKRLDRAERKEAQHLKEEYTRAQRMRENIQADNDEIANRPAQKRQPPSVLKRSSTFAAGRSSADAKPRSGDAVLADSMRGLGLSDSEREGKMARLRALNLEREEDEAQRRRLSMRMDLPSRRASVGPGTRRARDYWQRGMYQYE